MSMKWLLCGRCDQSLNLPSYPLQLPPLFQISHFGTRAPPPTDTHDCANHTRVKYHLCSNGRKKTNIHGRTMQRKPGFAPPSPGGPSIRRRRRTLCATPRRPARRARRSVTRSLRLITTQAHKSINLAAIPASLSHAAMNFAIAKKPRPSGRSMVVARCSWASKTAMREAATA